MCKCALCVGFLRLSGLFSGSRNCPPTVKRVQGEARCLRRGIPLRHTEVHPAVLSSQTHGGTPSRVTPFSHIRVYQQCYTSHTPGYTKEGYLTHPGIPREGYISHTRVYPRDKTVLTPWVYSRIRLFSHPGDTLRLTPLYTPGYTSGLPPLYTPGYIAGCTSFPICLPGCVGRCTASLCLPYHPFFSP